MVLCKLVLIAQLEIGGTPYDDYGYALSAIKGYWGVNAHEQWHFIRPPGFILFVWSIFETGIPYRIGLELFYMGSVYFLSRSLLRVSSQLLLSLVAGSLALFHPWTLIKFNTLLTEPFFLGLLLIFTGLLIRLLLNSQWSWKTPALWGTGLLLGCLLLTRREAPLLYASLLFTGLLNIILFWKSHAPERSWKHRCLPMAWLGLPIAVCIGMQWSVSAINYSKWQIFATNEQEAPGFSGLLNTLYKIQTPDDTLYAPVTRKTLEMGCDASPTLNQIRPQLLSTDNAQIGYGQRLTGRAGELGPWMWWRVYSSIGEAGLYKSPKIADEWMQQATKELRAALKEGVLPKRGFSLPFPFDANIQYWAPQLGEKTWATAKRAVAFPKETTYQGLEFTQPVTMGETFDRAANRRSFAFEKFEIRVEGWAFAKTGALDFVTLEDEHGQTIGTSPMYDAHYGFQNLITEVTGKNEALRARFRITAKLSPDEWFKIGFWKDGQRLDLVCIANKNMPLRSPQPKDSGKAVMYQIDRIENPFWNTDGRRVYVEGWAFTKEGPITHVVLKNTDQEFLKIAAFNEDRPDMKPMFRAENRRETEALLGFKTGTITHDYQKVSVMFYKDQQFIHEIPLDSLEAPCWAKNIPTASDIPLSYGFNKILKPEPLPQSNWREKTLFFWNQNYLKAMLWIGMSGGFLSFFIALKFPRAESISRNALIAICGLLVVMILLRIGFYGLVEAMIVPDQERYVESISPLTGFVGAIMLFMLTVALLNGLLRAVIALRRRWIRQVNETA
jgi:hypothetical protein